MTNKLKVNPQQILVGEVAWTLPEIQQLKDLYGGAEGMSFPKVQIRSSPVLQKALRCDAVVCPKIQKGETALLLLSQVGFDLIGML